MDTVSLAIHFHFKRQIIIYTHRPTTTIIIASHTLPLALSYISLKKGSRWGAKSDASRMEVKMPAPPEILHPVSYCAEIKTIHDVRTDAIAIACMYT